MAAAERRQKGGSLTSGSFRLQAAIRESSARESGVRVNFFLLLIVIRIGRFSWSTHFGRAYPAHEIGLYFVLESIGTQRQSFVDGSTNVFDHTAILISCPVNRDR